MIFHCSVVAVAENLIITIIIGYTVEFFSSCSQADEKRPVRMVQQHPLTHQSQYAGLGLFPSVRLNRQTRSVLSPHNTSISSPSSVTVKIAPPDVLKPPTPVSVFHIFMKFLIYLYVFKIEQSFPQGNITV